MRLLCAITSIWRSVGMMSFNDIDLQSPTPTLTYD